MEKVVMDKENNFVDSVFVSRVSEDALTALSLSAPVQVLASALGLGNAVGLFGIPRMETKGAILKVGFPSTVVQVLTSFVSIAMNSIL